MRAACRIMLLVGILAVQLPAAGAAATTKTFRDEFTTSSWSQNHGDTNWANAWEQIPRADDEIGIKGGNDCVEPKCLKMGSPGLAIAPYGIYRGADLSGAVAATLTFSYKRALSGAPADGGIRIRVGNAKPAETTIGTIALDAADDSFQTFSADISDWLTATTHIGFLGYGDVVNGTIHIDNVQIVATFGGAPTFTSDLADRTDTENDTVSLAVTATDPEDDPLSFSATGLPPGIAIDPETGEIDGKLSYAAAAGSPYSVTVSVTDGFAADTDTFTWAVVDLNRKPQLDSINDADTNEGSPWSFQATASDPDLPFGDTLVFTLDTAPAGMQIGASSGTMSWSPSEQQGPGTYTVRVRVTDSGSPKLTHTRTFEIDVAEVNSAPTLESITDQTSGVGDRISLQLSGTDSDLPANSLTYSATGLPPGLKVIGSRITGKVAGSDGTYTVTAKVVDDGSPQRQDTVSFQWFVTSGNNAPVLEFIAKPTIGADGRVTFTAHATDPDGDKVTYSLTGAVPSGASIKGATGAFNWTPTIAQRDTSYAFFVVATDDGSPSLSDAQRITIDLPPVNLPPTIHPVADQQSIEGDAVNLAVSASDGNNPPDTLAYAASGLPAGLRIDTMTGRITGTVSFSAASTSPHSVTVTATDSGTPPLGASTTFAWVVADRNRPPTVSGPSELVVATGQQRSVTLAAADPDGDRLSITLASPARLGEVSFAGEVATYTAGSEPGLEVLTIIVSDGDLTAAHPLTVEVRFENGIPVASDDTYEAVGGQILRVPAPGVMGNDSDPDGHPLTITLKTPPAVGELDLEPDGSFTLQPPAAFAGRIEFEYTVSDGLDTSSGRVQIKLTVPAGIIDPGDRERIVDSSVRQIATPGASRSPAVSNRSFIVLARSTSVQLDMLSIPLALLIGLVIAAITLGRVGSTPLFASRSRIGTLASFHEDQGFGHIVTDDGFEYFVSRSAFGAAAVSVGDRVRFRSISAEPRHLAVSAWQA